MKRIKKKVKLFRNKFRMKKVNYIYFEYYVLLRERELLEN